MMDECFARGPRTMSTAGPAVYVCLTVSHASTCLPTHARTQFVWQQQSRQHPPRRATPTLLVHMPAGATLSLVDLTEADWQLFDDQVFKLGTSGESLPGEFAVRTDEHPADMTVCLSRWSALVYGWSAGKRSWGCAMQTTVRRPQPTLNAWC